MKFTNAIFLVTILILLDGCGSSTDSRYDSGYIDGYSEGYRATCLIWTEIKNLQFIRISINIVM